MEISIRDSAIAHLDPGTLYRILRLRVDVFVVEQNCPYPELDGRDLEPDARQLWVERSGEVVATLRLLRDLVLATPGGTGHGAGVVRIGRVATAPAARGQGLATELIRRAIELAGTFEIVLDAQAHLQDWYASFGFARDGQEYLEDGIAHVPMRRRG
ncbi:MAG: GNAT family N-acetyltransferase [Jatrophihabitantaceae bacterium]